MRVRHYRDPGKAVINTGLACVWIYLVTQGAFAAYGATLIITDELWTRTNAFIEWAAMLI